MNMKNINDKHPAHSSEVKLEGVTDAPKMKFNEKLKCASKAFGASREKPLTCLTAVSVAISAVAITLSVMALNAPKTSLDRFKDRVETIAKAHNVETPRAFDPNVKDTGDLIVTDIAPKTDVKAQEKDEEVAHPSVSQSPTKAELEDEGDFPTTHEANTLSIAERQKRLSPIDRIVSLPMDGMRAVASKDGKIMYMGESGRFVIVGKLYDIWERKPLHTIEEIAHAANHIPVEKFGLTPEGKSVISTGNGKETVTAFVDPLCGWCHKLMEDITKDQSLLENYRFHFYVIPALGDASHMVAKHLFCANASAREKFQAFMKGSDAILALKTKEKCEMAGYNDTLMTAQLLGVQGVPFVVASDGRFVAGKPQDVKAFLKGEKDKTGSAR